VRVRFCTDVGASTFYCTLKGYTLSIGRKKLVFSSRFMYSSRWYCSKYCGGTGSRFNFYRNWRKKTSFYGGVLPY